MKCFDWKLEKSRVFGYIKRPVAEIALKANEDWQPIVVYVDSGADVTVLKRSYGELIGIAVEKGKYAEFKGVSGNKIKTYIHVVEMKIGDVEIEVKVAFAIDDTPPNLLGRIDVFNVFDLYFKSRTEETCFAAKSLTA